MIALLWVIGSVLIIADAKNLIQLIMYIIAAVLIIAAISAIISSGEYLGRDKQRFIIQAIILIIVGVLIFFVPANIMRIIIGSILILISLVRLFTVENKRAMLKEDAWKIIIGLFLIFSIESVLDIVVGIFGCLIICIGIFLLYVLIKQVNHKDCPNILYELGMKYILKKGKKKWE